LFAVELFHYIVCYAEKEELGTLLTWNASLLIHFYDEVASNAHVNEDEFLHMILASLDGTSRCLEAAAHDHEELIRSLGTIQKPLMQWMNDEKDCLARYGQRVVDTIHGSINALLQKTFARVTSEAKLIEGRSLLFFSIDLIILVSAHFR
jgi:hypothetical protein